MSAANGTPNAEANGTARVPDATTSPSLSYLQLGKIFKGKSGEDVERFLKNVKKCVDQRGREGKYSTELAQNEDHVALIYAHCGSRVQEFIDGLDDDWEVNPDRVRDRLVGRYRTLRNTGLEIGRSKIDGLRQKPGEDIEHYIKKARKISGFCNGRDDMYDQLTSRFCRGIRVEPHRVSLATAVAGIQDQGRIKFEACMAYAQGMLLAEPAEDGLDSDTDDDSDTDSDDSDTDSSDDDRDRRRKKKKRKEKKQKKERRKCKEKLKERYEKIVEERLIPQKPKPEEELGNRLEEIRKEKEEALRVKEEVQREKEEWQRQKEEIRGLTAQTRIGQ
jgi:hypothetical protein